MKVIEAFPILALMPMLTFLIGCGAKYPIDWSTAFYKPEVTQAKFVMDYKEGR